MIASLVGAGSASTYSPAHKAARPEHLDASHLADRASRTTLASLTAALALCSPLLSSWTMSMVKYDVDEDEQRMMHRNGF